MVEFSNLGLPMIIISPKGNALSNWAEINEWIPYLDKLDEKKIGKIIIDLTKKQSWQNMAEQARQSALNEFNSKKIQEQFEGHLASSKYLRMNAAL